MKSFAVKSTVAIVAMALSTSWAITNDRKLYVQGDSEYAFVPENVRVLMNSQVTEPNPEEAYFFAGTRNRTGNPVRIIWYGNPDDLDGLIPQIGAKNKGYIYGSLEVNAQESYRIIEEIPLPQDAVLTEWKDYRSSIATDGEANGIDAYGWTAQPNHNDVEINLRTIENSGLVEGRAILNAGKGTHRSIILSNASANGVSIYGDTDYGTYIDNGTGDAVAVDAMVGGSRSAVSMRTSALRMLADANMSVTPDNIHLAGLEKNTDLYGKSVVIALERLDNQGLIQGQLHANGHQDSVAAKDTPSQDYATVSWSSGNGVSLRAKAMTKDKRTYAYEEQNKAMLNAVHNDGVISGVARLTAGATVTTPGTNYTRSYDSGNAISVAAHTLRFAKHRTASELGTVNNTGRLMGELSQQSANNSVDVIHVYSQSQAYGGGNGINVYLEMVQQALGTLNEQGERADDAVVLKIGDIDNIGVISGQADIRAGNGYGDIRAIAYGSGNGISAFLQAGAAQTYSASMGNIDNKGIISGSLVTKAGIGGNEHIESPELAFLLITNDTWSKLQRPNQVPDAPQNVRTCSSDGCREVNAISDIKGSGNGISLFTGRHNGDTASLGHINNSGVISGYAKMYHGYSNGSYARIDYLASGVGIAFDQKMKSDIINTGIISGNHAALLAKSKIDDAYSVNEPKYLSGYEGQIQNYGLMAGTMIAGNYDGTRTGTEAKQDTYLYFNADEDPVQNKGTLVYFAPKVPDRYELATAKYNRKQIDTVRTELDKNFEKSTDVMLKIDIKTVKGVRKRVKNFGITMRASYARSVEKVEQYYGGVTTGLSIDQRLDFFYKIYDALNNHNESSSQFRIADLSWLTKAQGHFALEKNARDFLGYKNKLMNRRKDFDAYLKSLGDITLGAGFQKLVDLYHDFVNSEISIMNHQLNTVNKLLTERYGAPEKPELKDEHLIRVVKSDNSRYGAIQSVVVAENSTIEWNGEQYQILNAPKDNSGLDSSYTAMDSHIENHIINGVGLSNAALVANQDLSLNKTTVNGLVNALGIRNNTKVTLNESTLNANGFEVLAMSQEGEKLAFLPYAVLGDESPNTLILEHHAIINGDIDFKEGDDQLLIADDTVRLNARLVNFGEGRDTLVLGKDRVSATLDQPIKVSTPLASLERIVVNTPAVIQEVAALEPVDEMVLNDALVYQGNYAMREGQTIVLTVHAKDDYGSLLVENGHLDISKGKLFIDAENFTDGALKETLNHIVSVQRMAEQQSEALVTEQRFYIKGKFAQVSDNSALYDFTLHYDDAWVNMEDLVDESIGSSRAEGDAPSPATTLSTAIHAVATKTESIVDMLNPDNSTITEVATILDEVLDEKGDSELADSFTKLSSSEQVNQAILNMVAWLSPNTAIILHSLSKEISEVNDHLGIGLLRTPEASPEKSLWFKPMASWQQQSSHGLPGYKAQHYGFVLGADILQRERATLGLLTAYMDSKVTGLDEARHEENKLNTWQLGVYGQAYMSDQVLMSAQLGYARSSIKGKRDIAFASEKAQAKYHADVWYASLATAYQMKINDQWQFKPYVKMDYQKTKVAGYQETGSVYSLRFAKNHYDTWTTELGMWSEYRPLDTLRFNAVLGVGVDLKDTQNTVQASYTVAPDKTFDIHAVKRGRIQGKFGLGVQYHLGKAAELGVQYQTRMRQHYIDHQAQLKLNVKF
ncbi:autotransporter outer membrane beta-barrel domain-containing protein [Basilea psittacipulmonis]|nr:autotransporter outer membrane beta-barrel domain-containing protein [Basilea psittacipulmonis]